MADQQAPVAVPVAEVQAAILNASKRLADRAALADDTREAAECARAVDAFASAFLKLDPNLDAASGVEPERMRPPMAQNGNGSAPAGR